MSNDLFKNKYRIESIRLKDYDYSENGYYFVTICTKNRECWFGDIVDGKTVLNQIGGIVKNEWIKTKQIRKNVKLDEYVVMPNHFHGIVILDNDHVEAYCNVVEAYCNTPLQRTFRSPSNNLGSIIRGFKSAVKRWCNKNGHEYFGWQRNYYEHIIQNEHELNRIQEYIINNPLNWESDLNNPCKGEVTSPLQRVIPVNLN